MPCSTQKNPYICQGGHFHQLPCDEEGSLGVPSYIGLEHIPPRLNRSHKTFAKLSNTYIGGFPIGHLGTFPPIKKMKIQTFVLSQRSLRGIGPYLPMTWTQVKTILIRTFRPRASRLPELSSKKWFFPVLFDENPFKQGFGGFSSISKTREGTLW